MKRILLVSSLIVPGVLFAVERSVIYLWLITATIILYLLFVATHRTPGPESATRRPRTSGQSGAESTSRKNSGIKL